MAKKAKSLVVKVIMYVVLIIKSFFLIPHGVCKYTPSCTSYAGEALTKLPLHRAIIAIVKRVLRCNPLSKGGYDPLLHSERDK